MRCREFCWSYWTRWTVSIPIPQLRFETNDYKLIIISRLYTLFLCYWFYYFFCCYFSNSFKILPLLIALCRLVLILRWSWLRIVRTRWTLPCCAPAASTGRSSSLSPTADRSAWSSRYAGVISFADIYLFRNFLTLILIIVPIDVLYFRTTYCIHDIHCQVGTSKMNLSEEVDLEDYISKPDKISCADIASICQEAGKCFMRVEFVLSMLIS